MIALLTVCGAALAWGPTGHRAVGLIAEHHLSRKASRSLHRLMGTESLARAATWADEIRSDASWQAREPNSSRWHYINAPAGEALTRPSDPDTLWGALERFEATAADRSLSPSTRREAVRWLVHLVGDAHQPLHAGMAADLGGNRVSVTFFSEPTNLHRVFDEHLIDHTRLSYTELAAFVDTAPPAEVARLQAAGVGEWLAESRALLPAVYELGDHDLSWDYVSTHTPVVERRIMEAGIRLAGVLNRIFD